MEHLEQSFMHLHAALSAATFGFSTSSESPEQRCDASIISRLACYMCKFVVIPTAPWKSAWDVFILLLIVYSAVTVPVRVCFSAEATTWGVSWWFEVAISLAFMGDLYLSFCTAYHEQGEWITSRLQIAKRYLTGWFWIDAPSSVPVELIQLVYTSGDQVKMLRLLRLLRLIRLMRLLKVEQYIDSIEENFDVNLRVLRLVGVVMKVVFVSHLLGCFWFYVGSAQRDDESAKESWLSVYDNGSALDASVGQQYLYSVYWALTTLTTVGYGDITAQNDLERAYTMFALLVSAMVFAYLMGDITALIASLDKQKAMIDSRMDAVKEYASWRKLPNDLRIRVRRYYTHFFQEQPGFDETEILEGLSHALRAEVTRDILKDTLGRLHLFTHRLPPDFQAAIYPKLKPLVVEGDGEMIFERGSFAHDLAFLVEGEVAALAEDGKSRQRRLTSTHDIMLDRETWEDLILVPIEGCFGQTVLMGRRREATYVVHGPSCKLMMISKDDLEQLMEDEPQYAQRMCTEVLKDFERTELVSSLAQRMRITRSTGEERAALIMQRCWRSMVDRMMAEHDTLFKTIKRARQGEGAMVQARRPVGSPQARDSPTALSRQGSLTNHRQSTGATFSKQSSQSFRLRAANQDYPEPEMSVLSRKTTMQDSSAESSALKAIMSAIEALQNSERPERSEEQSSKLESKVATLEHQVSDIRGMVQQVLERLAEPEKDRAARYAQLRDAKGGSSYELLTGVRNKLSASAARKRGASPPPPRNPPAAAYTA